MTPLVIAHRGAPWELPENTLPAFERAIELGADYVEFDVHATETGELVVTHDRASNSLLQSREVPRLEEVLDLCSGRIGVMVELKTPYRYRRHDVVRRTVALLPDDAFVLSFESRALREVTARRTIQHVGFGVSLRRAAAGRSESRARVRRRARSRARSDSGSRRRSTR